MRCSPPGLTSLLLLSSGAELEIREVELCASPHSSLKGEPLYSTFLPLLALQELQRPVAGCLSPDILAASPSSQLYTSPDPHEQEPDLLASDLYQPQLIPLAEDGVPSASQCKVSRQLQTNFFIPSTPVLAPAIVPSFSVPDFRAVGGFLCPSSALCPPSLQPRSLMQWWHALQKTFLSWRYHPHRWVGCVLFAKVALLEAFSWNRSEEQK